MTLIFDHSLFDKSKYSDLIECTCSYCGKTFLKTKKRIREAIQKHRTALYCSTECANKAKTKRITLKCMCCGKLFERLDSEFKKSKTKNFFCSHTCSASFNNKNRKRTEESREKTRESLKKFYSNKETKQSKTSNICKICGHEVCNEHNLCKAISVRLRTLKKLGFDESKIGTDDVFDELERIKHIFIDLYINQHKTLQYIADQYNINVKTVFNYVDFFGIEHRSMTESIDNFYNETIYKKSSPNHRKIYQRKTKFNYKTEGFEKCEGYEDLLKYGRYHPTKNPNGYDGDHLFSRMDGFDNNVPIEIIRHPSNCRFIPHLDNVKKGRKSTITLDELYKRYNNW